MDKKIGMFCPECGSDNWVQTADAYWSVSEQCWKLGNVCGDGLCSDCGCQCPPEEKEVSE